TRAAAAALDRLSDHLLELAKGLPVLVGLGRASAQTKALKVIADNYAGRTMETLRTAFLSSLALELISTISVAVVAVFIGVRLVYGDMGLETGLLALILAPECFLPLREVGAAHHASDEGLEAGKRVRGILDEPRRASFAGEPGGTIGLRNLSLCYDGSRTPVANNLNLTLPLGSITALRGPSGCGKSTIMNVLAGTQPAGLEVSGEVSGVDQERIAWVPQHPELLMDTVRAELSLYAGLPCDHPALADELAGVGGGGLLDRATAELSPGEVRRVAVARALARIRHTERVNLLLLDEPTAHVDDGASHAIRTVLRAIRGRVTVLLIAHDDATAAVADRTIKLSGPEAPAGLQMPVVAGPAAATAADATGAEEPGAVDSSAQLPAHGLRLLRNVLALTRPWSPRFLAALGCGMGSALFAAALAALSGWLIVRASIQPPILFLLAAIVGVRFFGIGRSLLRYCERLWLHDAIFFSTNRVRLQLWNGLLDRAESWRALSRGSGAIERLVGDIDELRDTAARAVHPPLTALLTGLAAVVATALLLPAALGWQIAAVTGGVLVAPLAAVWAERSAGAAGLQLRAESLARTSSLLRAGKDISANGLNEASLQQLAAVDRGADRGVRRAAWAAGVAQAIVILVCGAAAVAITVTSSGLPAETTAVVVLLQLALIEPFTAGSAAVQQWGPLGEVTRRIHPELSRGEARTEEADHTSIETISLRGVSVGYGPGNSVVKGVDLDLARGGWTALTGPSGSGKSTLVGALLGFLPVTAGSYLLNGRPAAGRPARIAWCPQEGHLFNSTIRANLQLARTPEGAATDAELWKALDAVGLGSAVWNLKDGLDARIGPDGDRLSGGQRQRLAVARALLAEADVLVLDEPTAHLDSAGARALLSDLRLGLLGRPVLLVTHNSAEAQGCDSGVQLALPGGGNHLRWEHEYA
ncbi:thiol reductant ABC exporter subunit CydC, partial [Arthrobacter sp. H5]|uniref:thiol reductant ABC exporter subunit CydC n=1 Tax=Arthrobacter sp. H5 TaxID=1267973 RepID=UPI000688CECA